MFKAKSIASLVPNRMTNFLFSHTGLQNFKQCRRSIIKESESCRDLMNQSDSTLDYTETSTDWDDSDSFEPSQHMTLFQAKGFVSQLERELAKQKKAKRAMMTLCEQDLAVAEARRASGCRRGFLLSLNKMKKHERDSEALSRAIGCLETLLLVISTEVNQAEAIADLSGEAPTEMKLAMTADSLRKEIAAILSEPASTDDASYDESNEFLREIKTTVSCPIVE